MIDLGNDAYNEGKLDVALDYYKKALEISKKTGERNTETAALSNIGLVYSALSKYDESIKYYQELMQLSEEIEDFSEKGSALISIGEIYWFKNQNLL